MIAPTLNLNHPGNTANMKPQYQPWQILSVATVFSAAATFAVRFGAGNAVFTKTVITKTSDVTMSSNCPVFKKLVRHITQ